ncbi:cation transporter [Kribbia dieselivorans]|uniref:cation transporter n=1 Tax=Kribbia dieselivorans TaxID=331526 RepID=UPI000A98EEDC|nr:cation transporter [Kribbia dieselivorans]
MTTENAPTNGSPAERPTNPDSIAPAVLRRTVIIVALLNLAYFFIEATVAWRIGSVALLADSVDFLEDTAVNLLIALALGWSLHRRAMMGKVMAGIILLPAIAALWQAIEKFGDPQPPAVLSLVLTAGGALVVNSVCAAMLANMRHHGGSMSTAAFLAARNDVYANAAIILMAGVTALTHSGWPDIILGLAIVLLNGSAAKEVWEVAEEERLAARALAGEAIDD